MTIRYCYDCLMTMEDVMYASGDGARYRLGARGIERLEAQRMASPQSVDPLMTAKRSYPLYDGHGNPDSPRRGGAHFPSAGRKRMIETLGRTATGYTIANEKKYDVWGAVRQSQSPGSHVVNPNKQYCANLGHTFDGESDLITMRARYYEPSTGRFGSEGPARDGLNWYRYANSSRALFVDPDGRASYTVTLLVSAGVAGAVAGGVGDQVVEAGNAMGDSHAYSAVSAAIGRDVTLLLFMAFGED